METPDYSKLACPKCGEKTDFDEIALTETSQRFSLDAEGEPDWNVTEILDAPTHAVLEIRCGKCYEIVWEGNKAQTLDYDPNEP